MTNIDIDPFAAPSPEQAAKVARSRATKSVQSSLFRRLGDRGYGRAGHLSWLLCFAGDTAHAKSAKAREKLATRPAAEIAGILDVVRASSESKGATEEWRSVCSAIVAALRSISAPPASSAASAASAAILNEDGYVADPRIEAAGLLIEKTREAKDRKREMVRSLVALGWPDNVCGTATQNEVRTYREADRILALLDSGIEASPAPWGERAGDNGGST